VRKSQEKNLEIKTSIKKPKFSEVPGQNVTVNKVLDSQGIFSLKYYGGCQ